MTHNDNSTIVPNYQIPYDLDAEEWILGSIVLEPSIFHQIRGIVSPGDFYREKNQWVADAFDRVAVDGSLNPYFALPILKAKGVEADYFRYLIESTPTSVHAVHFAQVVRDLSLRRRLMHLAGEVQITVSDGRPLADIITDFEMRFVEFKAGVASSKKDLDLIWAKDLEPPSESITPLWSDVIFPASLHLLSGEAGVGKTTWLYNLAAHACRGEEFMGLPFHRRLRVLYLDLETPAPLQNSKALLISRGVPPVPPR